MILVLFMQREAVGQIVDLMRREAAANPATLFVVSPWPPLQGVEGMGEFGGLG